MDVLRTAPLFAGLSREWLIYLGSLVLTVTTVAVQLAMGQFSPRIVTALLTAFYMARLMTMTFLGSNRTGEQERGHLHDAPWVMTGPLVVLGVLIGRASGR